MDASFFILISFGVFSYLFYKKLWPAIKNYLDDYAHKIKNEFSQKHNAIHEHKKLKTLFQERIQNLDQEIEEIKKSASSKLEFLKIKLDKELDSQFAYRQKNFQQLIHRIHRQQRKKLQSLCADYILAKVKEEIKKNATFPDEYVLSVLVSKEKTKVDSHASLD